MVDSSKECEKYAEEAANGLHDEQNIAPWQSHIQGCPRCRKTWMLYEHMVSELRRTPVPRLSSNFNYRLRQKLRGRVDSQSLSKSARLLLRLYWIGASLAGSYVALHVPWPKGLPAPMWVVLISIGLGTMVPLLGILRKPGNAVSLALRILE
jgi:hypothetical protein